MNRLERLIKEDDANRLSPRSYSGIRFRNASDTLSFKIMEWEFKYPHGWKDVQDVRSLNFNLETLVEAGDGVVDGWDWENRELHFTVDYLVLAARPLLTEDQLLGLTPPNKKQRTLLPRPWKIFLHPGKMEDFSLKTIETSSLQPLTWENLINRLEKMIIEEDDANRPSPRSYSGIRFSNASGSLFFKVMEREFKYPHGWKDVQDVPSLDFNLETLVKAGDDLVDGWENRELHFTVDFTSS